MQRHKAGGPEAQVERKRKEAEYLQLNHDYKETFSSEAGKRVLNDILSKGKLWATTFTGNSTGMFLEGKRDLALYVMKRAYTGDPNIMIGIMQNNQKLKLERKNDGNRKT